MRRKGIRSVAHVERLREIRAYITVGYQTLVATCPRGTSRSRRGVFVDKSSIARSVSALPRYLPSARAARTRSRRMNTHVANDDSTLVGLNNLEETANHGISLAIRRDHPPQRHALALPCGELYCCSDTRCPLCRCKHSLHDAVRADGPCVASRGAACSTYSTPIECPIAAVQL